MKIDVQGFDLNVLKGSIETIKKHRMPIIFEYENTLEDKMGFRFDDFEIVDYHAQAHISAPIAV